MAAAAHAFPPLGVLELEADIVRVRPSLQGR